MRMKRLKNKHIRMGIFRGVSLFIAVLLVMMLPGVVVTTPVGIISVGSGVVLAASESLAPAAYVTQTNLDGTIADIDEDPDTPDTDWADVLDASVSTIAHVSFLTPTGNPTAGAGLQEFKIWVKKGGDITKTPSVEIFLYENGVLLATVLAASDVTSDSGEPFSGTWDASLLTNADGSGVECWVEGTKSGAAPPRAGVSVGAVEWNVDYTPPNISNTPSSWAFGAVDPSSTYETGITYSPGPDPPASGFRITNNVAYDVNITISATGMGSGWLLADSGDPDTTHYTLWAGTELTSGQYNIQVTSGGVPLITVLESSTRDWGLKLMTPTSFSDGGLKSGTVTLTATAA